MLQVPQLEKEVGIETYVTQSLGIGGRIRQLTDDFVVEELLVDGSLAEVSAPVEVWEPAGEGRLRSCDVLLPRHLGPLQHGLQGSEVPTYGHG